jgi:hypothetical protein
MRRVLVKRKANQDGTETWFLDTVALVPPDDTLAAVVRVLGTHGCTARDLEFADDDQAAAFKAHFDH